jgi:hypothetical protein
MGRKQGHGGGRQLKKQKLPAEVSAARTRSAPSATTARNIHGEVPACVHFIQAGGIVPHKTINLGEPGIFFHCFRSHLNDTREQLFDGR